MPIAVSITGELTICTVTGQMTRNEVPSFLEDFYESPTRDILWDLRQADLSMIENKDVEDWVKFARDRASPGRKMGKTALVADSDPEYGYMRMTDLISEMMQVPLHVKTFRSMQEAMVWIKSE